MKLIVMVMTMMMISEGSMIDQTCKQTPDFKLCVSLLNSDPRGSSADTSGLALILIDKIKVLATKTLTEINGLYKKRPELKQALDQCSRRYKTILNADVPEAIEAISKGVPKFGEDGVMDAGVEASACEEGFQGKSPLTSLTKSMQNISSVTRAVLALYTIRTWSMTVLENVNSLVGKSARPEYLQKLTYLCWNPHKAIRHIDTVRAYTFGSHFFVEVDIVLPSDMPLQVAHDIGESLQEKLELLEEIERAFVHLDYEYTHKPEHASRSHS